jgi:hypothetical protein
MAHRDREIQERLRSLPRISRDWRGRLAEMIQRGIGQGVFRPEVDPHLTALVIHDIQHLYLDRQVAGTRADYDPEHMEAALELLIEGLRVAGSTRAKKRVRKRAALPRAAPRRRRSSP